MATGQEVRQWQWNDALMTQDDVQNERLAALEARILQVEQAVQEIAGMAKIVKVIAIALAASLGMDLQGLI